MTLQNGKAQSNRYVYLKIPNTKDYFYWYPIHKKTTQLIKKGKILDFNIESSPDTILTIRLKNTKRNRKWFNKLRQIYL